MSTLGLVTLSSQQALQQALDVVANNVANASTTGFKREALNFSSQLSKSVAYVSGPTSSRDITQGSISPTNNQLDVAIQGSGYLEVQQANGSTAYTRGGSLVLNNQGQIATLGGQPILGVSGQPITIPDTVSEINIAKDGDVTAKVDNGTSLAELGKIALVNIPNEQAMEPQGGNIYTTNQTATPVTNSVLVQGSLEQSNVQPIKEMTDLINVQRAYERASNLISEDNTRTADAMTRLSKTTA